MVNYSPIVHQNGVDLTITADFINHGELRPQSLGSSTDIFIQGDIELSGSGRVLLNQGNSRLIGSSAAGIDMLTHAATHTIEGGGVLGNASMNIDNLGLIDANNSSVMLTLQTAPLTINRNVIQARNGAQLRLISTTVSNQTGVIRAMDTSLIEFNDVTIAGGVLTNTGSGSFLLTGTSLFDGIGLTNYSTILHVNGVDLTLLGTIVNEGQLEPRSIGSLSAIYIEGDVDLQGSGRILLGNHSGSQISGSPLAGTDRLTHAATHTIEGGGTIGGSLVLDNHGLIDANTPGVDINMVSPLLMINRNTLQATNGSRMVFTSMTVSNQTGVLRAMDRSTIEFNAETVVGGILTNAGSGSYVLSGTTRFEGVGLTNYSTILHNNSVDLTLTGTIVNEGRLEPRAVSSQTAIFIEGDVDLQGSGRIVLGNHLNSQVFGSALFGTNRLFHGPNHTIEGGGTIAGSLLLDNRGLIDANHPTVNLILQGPSITMNRHVIQARDGADIVIASSTISNQTGVINAMDTSTIELNLATIVGGIITNEGSGFYHVINSSTLHGVGLTNYAHILQNNAIHLTLTGNIVNHGDLEPRSLSAITAVYIDGNVNLQGSGRIHLGGHLNSGVRGSPAAGADYLIHGAQHTIEGGGTFGDLTLENHG
ncbi:MAG: hypothetical protein AAF492_11650, partial [Verrucomicrobiota bacterium]